MIVGHGDIAKALIDTLRAADDSFIFFASGVSNSRETNPKEFMREKQLLLDQPKDKRLVYFSTLAIYYSDTPYAYHKITMELLVKRHFKNYTIVRLGNIDWGDNPNTIINFFKNQYKNNVLMDIQDVYRYILTKKEFIHWIEMIPNWNTEMNITGKLMKVQEIVDQYSRFW